MTPKEKAKELVEKFYKLMPFKDRKLGSCEETPDLIIEMENLSAIQCAIIAVDEILNLSYFTHDPTEDDDLYKNYWQQVKQELQKL